MQGLMMEYPLTLTQFFEHSRRLFAQKTLATRVPGRPLFRYTYADFPWRVARRAGAWRRSGCARATASVSSRGIPITTWRRAGPSP